MKNRHMHAYQEITRNNRICDWEKGKHVNTGNPFPSIKNTRISLSLALAGDNNAWSELRNKWQMDVKEGWKSKSFHWRWRPF